MLAEQPISGEQADQMERDKHAIFNSTALFDLLSNEIEHYIDNYGDPEGQRRGGQYTLTKEEGARMETALMDATKAIISEFVLS